MKLTRYISNVSALQFFQLFRFTILLLVSISFAKSSLTTEEIGLFEKLIFLSGAVSFFWVNGLIQSLLSLYNNNKTFVKGQNSPVLFNSLILSVGFSFVVTLILLLAGNSISSFFISTDSIPLKWLFVTYFFLTTPSFLLEYVYLLINRPVSIIYYGLITFVLQFLCVTVPVWAGYGIAGSITGLIIVSALRLVWLVIIVLKHSSPKISFGFMKEHLKLASPLIAGALVSGSVPYIDGIIVAGRFDDSVFAVYRYGARELPIALILASTFSNSMVPEYFKSGSPEVFMGWLKKRSLSLMHFLFPLSILLVVFSEPLFHFIFNPRFAEAASVFNVFLLLTINRLLFPHTILLGMKKTNILFAGSVVELLFKILFSLWLVNYFGLAGIALGTFIAFCLEQAILIYYNYKYLGLNPSKYINFRWHIIYSVVLLFVYFIVERDVYGW